jgi:hypothetical protein
MDNTAQTLKIFNGEEKVKLEQIFKEGLSVMHEVETLNEGLNDTLSNLAKEWDISASVLKKALKTAYKNSWDTTDFDHLQVSNILDTIKMK